MHNPLYRIGYKDIDGNNYQVDILRKNYIGDCTVLDGAAIPFVINYPKRKNRFQAICGSGATINVVIGKDDDINTLVNLYSNDILKHKVKAYKNNICFWQGYINTEVYKQSLGQSLFNISITANDGLALLSRMKYTDTGFKTITEVIELILSDLDIDFTSKIIDISKKEIRLSEDADLFDSLKINSENYYDEKGDAMTLRDVLEAIITPFGAICVTDKNRFIIKDIDSFTAANKDFKNVEFIGIPTSNIIAGINKQVITYSGYPYENIFPNIDFSEPKNWKGTPRWQWDSSGCYVLKDVTGVKDVTLYNNCYLTGTKDNLKNKQCECFIKTDKNLTSSQKIFSVESNCLLTETENEQAIKITVPFKIRIKNGHGHEANNVEFTFSVNVGNLYWDGGKWKEGHCTFVAYSRDIERYLINDWFDVSFIVSKQFGGGKMTITLYGGVDCKERHVFRTSRNYGDVHEGIFNGGGIDSWFFEQIGEGDVLDILFKEPTTEYKRVEERIFIAPYQYYTIIETDEDGDGNFEEADGVYDTEIIGELDERWINAGDGVELKHGDSLYNNMSDRGGFYLPSYKFTGKWNDGHTLFDLLLKSIIANNYNASEMITGTIVDSDFSQLDVFVLDGKKYIFMGGNYDTRNSKINGQWLELQNEPINI